MEVYPSDSLLGSVVDRRYRIDERVGAGAFGCVYSAWHLSLDVRVALKVLMLDAELSELERAELVSRFLNEARVLTRLKHPNIVAALDLGTVALTPASPTLPYLVMEWCDGQTLKELVTQRGRLSLEEAFEIVEPLADALAHAHAAGVLHRDIKPSNVMLSEHSGRPSPRLIDFGIAKLAPPRALSLDTQSLTAGVPVYTPGYAAPEQVAGARTSPATDVHGLGLLLIELLTGRPPYESSDDPRQAIVDAVRPTADREGVEIGAFGPVIARAVALRPSERFHDGRALRDALRSAALTQFGEGHPVPSARQPQVKPRVGALPAAILALVVVLVASVLVVRALRREASAASAPDAPSAAVAFCDLDDAEQRRRLADTGLKVQEFAPDMATLEGDADSVFTVAAIAGGGSEALEDALVGVRQIDALGLAYAMGSNCLVYTKGPRSQVAPTMDKLLAGLDVDQRGDTCGGPDPLGVARPAPSAWQGTKATSLAGLSPEELIVRALATGIRIHDADRSDQRLGQWLELRFKRRELRGVFEYFRGPYARVQLLKSMGKAPSVVYYAIEEPVVVAGYGLADPTLLENLVGGLGATVQRSQP